jgi:nucleoside-diphosphate-sugar epimerase
VSPLGPGDRVAVLGLGRVGTRIAARLRARGVSVRGSRRALVEGGSADLVRVDLATGEGFPGLLDGVRVLIHAAAPGSAGYDAVYGSGLRALLDAARAASIERVLVLGSVGVYGEDGGATVTELTPPDPRDPNGRILLAAEEAVRAANGLVLRLAGLYAPGRGPQTLLGATPRGETPHLRAPAAKLLNLIHEDDAALAAVVALDRWDEARATGNVLNASDGSPTTRERFYAACARAQGLPEPVFDLPGEAGLGRRVSSERLRALGFSPRFATFADGLAGSW